METKKSKIGKYIRSHQNIELELRKFSRRNKFCLLFSSLCLILVVYVVVHRPTYIVPYGLEKKVKLSVNRMTPYYLMRLARNDAETYFNVTPQTIKGASSIFLTRIEPSLYGKTQVLLRQRSAKYLQDNKTTMFFPENKSTVKGTVVQLKGNLITYVGDKKISAKETNLTVTYEIENGTSYIQRWQYV